LTTFGWWRVLKAVSFDCCFHAAVALQRSASPKACCDAIHFPESYCLVDPLFPMACEFNAEAKSYAFFDYRGTRIPFEPPVIDDVR